MTATDAQVRIIMRERRKGRTQEQAAAKANIGSRRTVRKYEVQGQLPSEMTKVRDYRTRPDAFEEDWQEVKGRLDEAPTLEGRRCLSGCANAIRAGIKKGNYVPSKDG